MNSPHQFRTPGSKEKMDLNNTSLRRRSMMLNNTNQNQSPAVSLKLKFVYKK
jgi:hypothetical protein